MRVATTYETPDPGVHSVTTLRVATVKAGSGDRQGPPNGPDRLTSQRPRARQVPGPTTPAGRQPRRFWKAFTLARVILP